MIVKCTGVKDGVICPLRDQCYRFLKKEEEDQLYLSYAPFESNCEFFYNEKRLYLEKREGHLFFDNMFEYTHVKEATRYKIDYTKMKSVEPAFTKFLN